MGSHINCCRYLYNFLGIKMRGTTLYSGNYVVALNVFHMPQGYDTYLPNKRPQTIYAFKNPVWVLCWKNTEKETQTLTHVTHNTNKWRSFTLKQQNKGGLTLVWNKWRDYSLPLRQQYLVMSPGASRERVKSQGVKVEPSNLHHSSSWWRREKRKLDWTGEQLEHEGGAQTRPPAMMDRGCLKRKEQLMLVCLQSERIKEGRLNKMIHH